MADTENSPVELIESYLELLEDEEFERAAALFTDDVTYIHPPTFTDIPKIEGRENIRRYFVEDRGPRDVTHKTTATVVEGNRGVLLGRSAGSDIEGGGHHYIAYARIADGRIAYYNVGILADR